MKKDKQRLSELSKVSRETLRYVLARSSNAGNRTVSLPPSFISGLIRSPQPIAIFAKQKTRNAEHQSPWSRYQNQTRSITMEYLILVAVVSMMALYALIIVGCLKQPEW